MQGFKMVLALASLSKEMQFMRLPFYHPAKLDGVIKTSQMQTPQSCGKSVGRWR